MATERLTERAVLSGNRLDVSAGLVRNVKVLGLRSRNGRRYTAEAIRSAVDLYNGIRVNIDHVRDSRESRSYADRFGKLRNVRAAGDGLYGDLVFNPKHALAEQFQWDCENNPAACGLSHVVDATTSRVGGEVQVESIAKVHCVDVVADPATVGGLFESRGGAASESADDDWSGMTQEDFARRITDQPTIDERRRFVADITE